MTTAWQAAIGGGALAMAIAMIATARVAQACRAREDLARRVDDLAARVRAIESRQAPRPRRVDRPSRPSEPREAPALIAVPSLQSSGSEAIASEATAELGRRFGAIWAMADSGDSPRAIAEATGHPIGQVELILGLRRPNPPSEATPHAR